MLQRCRNPNASGFHKYGAKGTKVCERWTSFEAFLEDMGEPPTSSLTLDRIDPFGGYEPGNCRWATMKEQQNNRTNNRHITFEGRTQTLQQWADETGLDRKTISTRIDHLGWPVSEALTLPTAPLSRKQR